MAIIYPSVYFNRPVTCSAPWLYKRRKENDWLQQEAQKVRIESVSIYFGYLLPLIHLSCWHPWCHSMLNVTEFSFSVSFFSRLPSEQCQCFFSGWTQIILNLGGQKLATSFLHSSFLQAINAVICWPVYVQKVPQASKHLCPAKLQTRCDVCCACQSICSFIPWLRYS